MYLVFRVHGYIKTHLEENIKAFNSIKNRTRGSGALQPLMAKISIITNTETNFFEN